MIGWPTINREPVELPPLGGYGLALWETLIELADLRPREWTLIGGQMVFVHAIEQGVEPLRMSSDLDVLVNARIVTGGVREFVRAIERRGFGLAGWSPEGLAHRYHRGPVNLDVLAPEGLGSRTDITTTPPGRTLQVPGGTQALARTELVVRRGFVLVEGGASSFDFGDDLLGGFVPDEGLGVLVPVVGPGVDRFDQLADASEAVAA